MTALDVPARVSEPPCLSPSRHHWHREGLAVLGLLTLVTAIFFHEIIFLGRTFLTFTAPASVMPTGPYGFSGTARPDPYRRDPGASAWVLEPQARKVGHEYGEGRIPLWNENQGFGAPLLANAQSGGLDLLRLPILISDAAVAWDAYGVMRTILGGLATYAFARALGLAGPASFVAAVSYAFSGHFLTFSNMTHPAAYYLLPLLLLGVELTVTGRARAGLPLTAITIALVVLVGHPEVGFIVVLFGAAFGGFRLICLARAVDRRRWLVRTAWLAGAGFLGVALTAPLVLPFLEYLGVSYNTHHPTRMLGLASVPIDQLIVLASPHFRGLPLRPIVPGPSHWIGYGYVGASLLVLATYGAFPARTPLYRGFALFMTLAATLLLAKIHGAPGINEIGRLPLLNLTTLPLFGAPLVSFCLAVLGGFGVHRLLAEPPARGRAFAAMAAVILFLLVGVLLNVDVVQRASTDHLLGTVGLAGLFATAAGVALMLRSRVSKVLAALVCGALVITELFLYAPHGNYSDRHVRWNEPPFVEFLRARQAEGPFRIFSPDFVLFPNIASVYGIDDIRSLDALQIDRYVSYLGAVIVPPGVTIAYTGVPSLHEGASIIHQNPWFNLAGVRYVVAMPKLGASRPDDRLMDVIVRINSTPERPVYLDVTNIDGAPRSYVTAPSATILSYALRITRERSVLRFAPILLPAVWDESKGDGVGFTVRAEMPGRSEVVYRREVDPKHDPAQRVWREEAIDLSRFVGRDIVLVLETNPITDPRWDWSGWAELRLTPADADRGDQYALVYDGEVQIFENRDALTRAFLVEDVTSVPDRTSALAMLTSGDIDPARRAIVEGAPNERVATLGSGGGTATVRRRNGTEVTIDVDTNAPSYLVLADAYYPGWTASIDGQQAEIYPTDVAFRGVFVPGGQHQVTFTYRPLTFTVGLAVASVSLAVIAAVALARTTLARRLMARGTRRPHVGPDRPPVPPGRAVRAPEETHAH